MDIYIDLSDWGFRFRIYTYRLCEKSFEAGEIAIGSLWIVWDEWV